MRNFPIKTIFQRSFTEYLELIFLIMFTDMDKVIISTGNILSVNKKAGQKAEDEVIQIQHFLKSNSDIK